MPSKKPGPDGLTFVAVPPPRPTFSKAFINFLWRLSSSCFSPSRRLFSFSLRFISSSWLLRKNVNISSRTTDIPVVSSPLPGNAPILFCRLVTGLARPAKNSISLLERPNILPTIAGPKREPPVRILAILSGSNFCLIPAIFAFVFSDMVLLMAEP